MPRLKRYKHHRGVHCGSAALRNVLHYYTGVQLTEAMCFGLGAGMSFTYVRQPGSPIHMITGRGSYIEANFCDALNVQLDVTSTDEADTAWIHLRQCIDDGSLVMIDTDMFELPYMVKRLNLAGGLHFGGHKVLVTGYCDEKGVVQLADYAWQQEQELEFGRLRAARDSRLGSSRPGNACFRFHFPDELPPFEHAICLALHNMVNQMRHPYLHFNGLPAIQRFCRQLPNWNKAMRGEDLQRNLSMAAFMLEKAGTGGGAFRNLYSRFLEEAGQLLDAPQLHRAASIYRDLSGHWREVAALLDESVDGSPNGIFANGKDVRNLMNDIAENEELGVEVIATFSKELRTMRETIC